MLFDEVPAYLRRVHAFVAGAARHDNALVADVADLEVFGRIIEAWDDTMTPLTRSEVAAAVGFEDDRAFEQRFDVLCGYGALEQQRLKANTVYWSPSPIALLSARIIDDLADANASDELADLIILALHRVDSDSLTVDELLAIARRLTRTINVITAAINRAVDVGTVAQVIEARPTLRAQKQVERIIDITEVARRRFTGAAVARLGDLIDSAGGFAHASERLIERLTEHVGQTGLSGLMGLLRPEQVDAAARRSGVDALARVGRDVVFDSPPRGLDRDAITAAVDAIGAPPRVRPAPLLPDPGRATDPTDVLDAATAAAAREAATRRRFAIAELAGSETAIVSGRPGEVWPTPVVRLVEGLALSNDPTVPVVMDVSSRMILDPDGPVAATVPLRLRRLDTTAPDADADGGARAGRTVGEWEPA